ncbi:anti-sigma factor family protein [Cryptosporangium aurantiacum]|uniref:Putative zinc-finger n=1 Tax=Cryptosporangium aurantiacum TaxID=134849 RepID=A0A1M7RPU3_9ACTN|nr:zf-HC2 domain-containing protein [Cryptosporangium aurantiacum]SHN48116.1 Putative zinc-finger [Cryptosporangium aurantiacum]
MTMPHGHVDIAGYLFGLLDPIEFRRVEEHLSTCPSCRHEVTVLREIENALDDVPPELFLDGPDPEADLLLQRTLRAAREETASRRSWGRAVLAGAAAVVAIALAVGGGVLLGRSGEPQQVVADPFPSATVAGTRTVSATDPDTGAEMTAQIIPADGWVRVNATLKGIKAGEECRMIVHRKDTGEEIASSWVISQKAASAPGGWPITGNAAIAPEDVDSVEIKTTAGRHLVTVDL